MKDARSCSRKKSMNKKGLLIILGIIALLTVAVAAMWKLNQQEQIARAARPAWTPAPIEKRAPVEELKSIKPVPAFQISPTAASLARMSRSPSTVSFSPRANRTSSARTSMSSLPTIVANCSTMRPSRVAASLRV